MVSTSEQQKNILLPSWGTTTITACYTIPNCYKLSEKDNMDIQSVVAQLRQEVNRIERAMAALVGLGSQPARRGRPPKVSQVRPVSGQKRRRMSVAARARIGAAKKAWWKKQNRAGAKKAKPVARKTAARKPMSAAMRKKLSALMKARWAERKAKA